MEDKVLETVVNGIKWEVLKDVLVKPLPQLWLLRSLQNKYLMVK